MIGDGRIVEDDLLSIVHRLKAIDSSYYVVENYRLNRFELHSKAQRGNTLALVLPFKALDERTINKVLRTRIERAERLKAELEQEERQREKGQLERVVKDAMRRAELCLK